MTSESRSNFVNLNSLYMSNLRSLFNEMTRCEGVDGVEEAEGVGVEDGDGVNGVKDGECDGECDGGIL